MTKLTDTAAMGVWEKQDMWDTLQKATNILRASWTGGSWDCSDIKRREVVSK